MSYEGEGRLYVGPRLDGPPRCARRTPPTPLAAEGHQLQPPTLLAADFQKAIAQQAELLLEHAIVIDAELERARADLAAFAEGAVARVALGAFATAISALVAPALEKLRLERPRLRLTIREHGPECFTHLDRGELDVAVTVDHRGGPPRGDPRYARWELLDDHLLVALPRGHRLARQSTVELLSLAAEPWIVGGTGGPCHEAGMAACMAAGFSPEIVHEMDSWDALLRLVGCGCGVGLVPELAVSAGSPPGVILRPPAGPQRPSRHIYAAVRAGAERSPFITPVVHALQAAAQHRTATRSDGKQRRGHPTAGVPGSSRRPK